MRRESWLKPSPVAALSLALWMMCSPRIPAAPDGPVEVLSPSGGEAWAKGSTQRIRWRTSPSIKTVDLHLWHEIVCVTTPCRQTPIHLYTIGRDIPNTGHYDWKVPSLLEEIGLPPSGRYYIRVRDPASRSFDDSVGPFRMLPRGASNQ